MKRREFITLLGGACSFDYPVGAQQDPHSQNETLWKYDYLTPA